MRGSGMNKKRYRYILKIVFSAVLAGSLQNGMTMAAELSTPIKVGIIGLDAHAVPFTKFVNSTNALALPPVSDMKITAAYPSFSPDIPFSNDNIQKNIEQMKGLDVEICGSIEEMVKKVDAVILASIDGRPHLEQAKPVFAARKPIFVDKPVAGSLVDIIELFYQAKQNKVPCFSNSSLRYSAGIAAMRNDPKVGKVLGCDAYSSSEHLVPSQPDLFHYGIHGCEILFTIMGTGCKSVTRVRTDDTDLVAGVWEDGRIGTLRGIRKGRTGFGATVFGDKGIAPAGKFEGYPPLLVEIARFFKTGISPMTVEDTLEIYAFLEAADESKRQGGGPVTIQSVLEKAKQAAAAKYGHAE